jgi:hypothetical protein
MLVWSHQEGTCGKQTANNGIDVQCREMSRLGIARRAMHSRGQRSVEPSGGCFQRKEEEKELGDE